MQPLFMRCLIPIPHRLLTVMALVAAFCPGLNLSAGEPAPLAKAGLTDISQWSFANGPLTLKTSANTRGLTFDFVTAKEPNNNYVAGRCSVDWMLPSSARIEIDAHSRARFAAYCALALTADDGRKFGVVLSADPKRGYVFDSMGGTVSLPMRSFKTADGESLAGGVHIREVTISFGLEAGVSNAVTFSRLELLAGSMPPLNNPSIRANPDQNWTFQSGPIELRTGFDEDGLSLGVSTQPGPNNNYLVAALRHQWIVPESGRIDFRVKAARRKAHYFACALTAADGRKYSAVVGGDPKVGCVFPTEFTVVSVDLAQLKSDEGKVPPAGTRIVSISLTLAFEPGVNTTIHLSQIDLVPVAVE